MQPARWSSAGAMPECCVLHGVDAVAVAGDFCGEGGSREVVKQAEPGAGGSEGLEVPQRFGTVDMAENGQFDVVSAAAHPVEDVDRHVPSFDGTDAPDGDNVGMAAIPGDVGEFAGNGRVDDGGTLVMDLPDARQPIRS